MISHVDWSKLTGITDVNASLAHAYIMMSATFPGPTRAVARKFLSNSHTKIRVGRVGSTHANITQEIIWADDHMKRQILLNLYNEKGIGNGRTLIFVNNKRSAELLDDFLTREKLTPASLHADLPQREREHAM